MKPAISPVPNTGITRNTTYGDLPQWLSPRECATYCNCTQWMIYQAIHRGSIPYRRIGPKIIQIPKSFFDQEMAQKQVTQ